MRVGRAVVERSAGVRRRGDPCNRGRDPWLAPARAPRGRAETRTLASVSTDANTLTDTRPTMADSTCTTAPARAEHVPLWRRMPWPGAAAASEQERLLTREWLVTNGLGGYA